MYSYYMEVCDSKNASDMLGIAKGSFRRMRSLARLVLISKSTQCEKQYILFQA